MEKEMKGITKLVESFSEGLDIKNKKYEDIMDRFFFDVNLITKHLYLGNILGAKDKDFMIDQNIKLVVNASPSIPFFYEDIVEEYIRLDVEDDLSQASVNKFLDEIHDILDKMHYYIRSGNNVFVHCYAGRQRSCAIVACYLLKYCNSFIKHPEDAILYIMGRRPEAFYFGKSINFLEAIVLF